MKFYFDDFIKGVNDQITKHANEGGSIFEITGSIFPTIANQSKWQFAKSGDELHLHDGNNGYYFKMPEGEKEHDFPLHKIEKDTTHSFGSEATHRGTVQVHKADPGSIYFTLQDGLKNPTYTFKHITGNKWRAIPKVKTLHAPTEIDKEAFIKAAFDANQQGWAGKALSGIINGADAAGRGVIRGTMALGHNPLLYAGAGLAGGALYDVGKRTLYNSKEENEEETLGDRLKRYIVPSAGLGLIGAGARTFDRYYTEFPLHRP